MLVLINAQHLVDIVDKFIEMSNSVRVDREPPSPIDNYMRLADTYAGKLRRGAPNALTLGNLTCGLFSLIMSINGLHRFSALFIFLAAVCDFFDGRVARMLNVSTPIGAQLDSLADVVSFGVAPAILAHSIRNWSPLMFIAFISFPYVFPPVSISEHICL